MSYVTLMIIKNLLLFISGMLFACIVLSLIAAYYMLHTEISEEMEENIIFGDLPDTKMRWKHPKNFLTALEMQYALIFWHFTNSPKRTLHTSLKRGQFIFISILIIFFLLLLIVIFGSFTIHPPPPPSTSREFL